MVSHLPPGHLDLMGQPHESIVKDARMVENNIWDETDVIKMGEMRTWGWHGNHKSMDEESKEQTEIKKMGEVKQRW